MLKKRKVLFLKSIFSFLIICFSISAFAQDNSPYSRYGIGDLTPSTNVTNRGMGGISAAYSDILSVNFNNPASYSSFQSYIEQRSKKVASGRVVLDVGLNFDNRTLVTPNTTQTFKSADAYFSYIQVGIPIRRNWGLSFGLRPISRISYSLNRSERLNDPVTGNFIDSVNTVFKGSGGAYLPTIGTGFAIKNFSIGFNVGYLFGRKEISTQRTFNDSVTYYPANYTSATHFGNVFFNAGIQYKIEVNKHNFVRLGLSGNLQQNLSASQDNVRQTFTKGAAGDVVQIDSVFSQSGVEGKIVYPASYKAGFVVQHTNDDASGWLIGADYTATKWSSYRYYGQVDSVQDNSIINVGGQFFPKAGTNYFSRIGYRFGFYFGTDYIKVQNKLPLFGASFGIGLPIANYNRLSPNQYSILNLSLEYAKRGNNNNLIKENIFRISAGFNLSDLWFSKRKYE